MTRAVAGLLFAIAVACEAFAYWGLNTVAGRAAFDEMAAMIPLAAAPVGLFAALAGVVMLVWRGRKKRA